MCTRSKPKRVRNADRTRPQDTQEQGLWVRQLLGQCRFCQSPKRDAGGCGGGHDGSPTEPSLTKFHMIQETTCIQEMFCIVFTFTGTSSTILHSSFPLYWNHIDFGEFVNPDTLLFSNCSVHLLPYRGSILAIGLASFQRARGTSALPLSREAREAGEGAQTRRTRRDRVGSPHGQSCYHQNPSAK